jgi:hypothetical protein
MAVNVSSLVVSIPTLNTGVPRISHSFGFRLTGVALLSSNDPFSGSSLPTLGNISEAIITIAPQNNAFGLLSFDVVQTPSTQDFMEGLNYTVTVRRTISTFGSITFWLRPSFEGSTSNDASAQDFTVSPSVVDLSEGDSVATFTVQVLADQVPELSESFHLHIQTANGTEVIGINSTLDCTIVENDNARGFIEFSSIDGLYVITAADPELDQAVTLSLVRFVGYFVDQTIQLQTSALGVLFPTTVQMLAGQMQVNISVIIVGSREPSLARTIELNIFSVLGGAKLGAMTSFSIFIPDHNDPHGVISLSTDFDAVVRHDVLNITFAVQRDFGVIGDLQVHWETTSLRPFTLMNASGIISIQVTPL